MKKEEEEVEGEHAGSGKSLHRVLEVGESQARSGSCKCDRVHGSKKEEEGPDHMGQEGWGAIELKS